MRRLFFGILATCQLMAGSLAATTCASPQELKALQSAALEQQLAAAAQSCHFTADYGLFVAKYRDPIVRSDRAVKAFFQRRADSEGYDAYKTRIAQDASLRSLHDPQFCRSAKTVFDMALGRVGAGKSPAMIQTGYEHCKTPVRTVMVTTTMPAARSLAVASPIPVPVPRRAIAAPRRVAADVPRTPRDAAVPQKQVKPDQPHYAAIERPRGSKPSLDDVDDADPEQDGNIPNAYRRGAVWVGAEAAGDRTARKRPPPMVVGPDGRWYVLIGHQRDWQRD